MEYKPILLGNKFSKTILSAFGPGEWLFKGEIIDN